MAVTAEDGELTYAALEAQSTQLAHALRRAGVQPETRVGLVMERTAALVVGRPGDPESRRRVCAGGPGRRRRRGWRSPWPTAA